MKYSSEKFKLGDKVVVVYKPDFDDDDDQYGLRGTVTNIHRNGVDVLLEDGRTNRWDLASSLEFAETYDTPLYKAMKE